LLTNQGFLFAHHLVPIIVDSFFSSAKPSFYKFRHPAQTFGIEQYITQSVVKMASGLLSIQQQSCYGCWHSFWQQFDNALFNDLVTVVVTNCITYDHHR
jgi:hypothetical protein